MGSFRQLDEGRSWFQDGKLIRPWHAYTRASRRPLPIGAVERVDVEVQGVLARIRRGHRLRIAITTNASPSLSPPPHELAGLLGGTTHLQRAPQAASHVNVPMIPSDALRRSAVDYAPCRGSC